MEDLASLSVTELISLANDYRIVFYGMPIGTATGSTNESTTLQMKMEFYEEALKLRDELNTRISGSNYDSMLVRELTRIYYDICLIIRSLVRYLGMFTKAMETNTSKLSSAVEAIVDSTNFSSTISSIYSDE